jgi:hypothetical protein
VALVIDTTFQPILVPCAEFLAKRAYFSGKHSQYGIKRELAHLPNGQCIFISKMHPGAVHDFTIFQEQVLVYLPFLEKQPDETSFPDPVLGEARWALMADKGYTGAERHCRAILPWKRNRRGGRVSPSALAARNRGISRDRIICDNFYGRMKTLYAFAGEKYRGALSEYVLFHDIVVSLTNFHVSKHPLRQEDLDMYLRIRAASAEEVTKSY